ncbi:hypothetical protein ACFL9S_16120 [Erwinia sp. AnSW2-5]|uniref:hypothetical protein n=1 Tax=Erwinia sp. AnSW2-5 TaxID=3367692 RepID=UPI00385EECC4
MSKIFFRSVSAVLIAMIIVTAGIALLAYLRTGAYLYSDKNVEECVAYTPEQAKMRVLQYILRDDNGWKDWQSALVSANNAGVNFVDCDINNQGRFWLVPFYENRKPETLNFGMLDCGTLVVEFASEKQSSSDY